MSDEDPRFQLAQSIERYLATLSKLYANDGSRILQEIVVNARVHLEEGWEYDSWDGGIHGHALHLKVPAMLFDSSLAQVDQLQQRLKTDLNRINHVRGEYIAAVFLELDVDGGLDWRTETGLLVTLGHFVPQDAVKRVWGDLGFRLFLSHKAEVKVETARLKERLRLFGISSFVAHEDIHPTKLWQDEIINALATMDGFVALMTENFHHSDWTDQEIGYAVARGVPIVPVRLGTDPYGFIGKYQALSSTWQTAAEDVVRILLKYDRMLNAYIAALPNCSSYDDANALARVLDSIEKLSAQQIDKLAATYNGNRQLRESYGFNGSKPDRYGPGLIEYINQLGERLFTFSPAGFIELVQ